ncbi:MAG TPA: hypothetical protein VMS17_13335 [Gemmataceae bacterium]|nr:hypothetical protein [Gemmataceae bacterium]
MPTRIVDALPQGDPSRLQLPGLQPEPPAPNAYVCLLGACSSEPARPLRTMLDARGRSWVLLPGDMPTDEAARALEAIGFTGCRAVVLASRPAHPEMLPRHLAEYGDDGER